MQTSVQDLTSKIARPITDETPINHDIEISLNNTPVNGTTNLTHSVQVISVSAISYVYKFGDSAVTDCQELSGYSSTVSISDPIAITPPNYTGSFALCVLGINSSGERQDISKAVKHIWQQSWAPFVYIEKPGQGLVQSASVNLKIHAPSEWEQVYITDDPTCSSGGSWQAVASQVGVTLAPDTTTKIAVKYAKFKTASGGTSDCYSDSILVASPVSVSACSGVTNTDAPVGEFIDSGGTALDYTNDESCSIVITGGTKVFTFDVFDTEADYDFITIYKDATGNPANLLLEVSGNSAQAPITSTSSTNILGFSSDGSVTAPGYKVTWTTPSITGSNSIKIAADAASSATRNVNLDIQFIHQFTQMYVTNTAACASGGELGKLGVL